MGSEVTRTASPLNRDASRDTVSESVDGAWTSTSGASPAAARERAANTKESAARSFERPESSESLWSLEGASAVSRTKWHHFPFLRPGKGQTSAWGHGDATANPERMNASAIARP